MRKYSLLAMLMVTFLSLACTKEKELPTENPTNANAFEQMNVPNNFTWRTHQDVAMHITGPYSGLVTVKKEDGSEVIKANLTQNTPLALQFGVPAYEEKLYIHYAGNIIEIQLTGAPIHHTFGGKVEALKA